ncbi:hypothetical protein ACXQDJ_02320, partial [Staphylococcus argenteus]
GVGDKETRGMRRGEMGEGERLVFFFSRRKRESGWWPGSVDREMGKGTGLIFLGKKKIAPKKRKR